MIWASVQDTITGCSSYLVGDELTGQALVVDPLQSKTVAYYVLMAQDLGLSISYVVDTHTHADHESAARELAEAAQATLALSHRAPVHFAYAPLKEGDRFHLGSVEVEVWEMPGHTPDSLCLVLRDLDRGGEPWLVMTGDVLFVGDVGRPDLGESSEAAVKEAARAQFQSLDRLMELPDYVEVYPAHFGASHCGGLYMSRKYCSTIGYERRYNTLLQSRDPDRFVAEQLKFLKPPPEHARQVRAANLGVAAGSR
jgi:glyoxylase-like metal-dependent hydrolase (beta-lactamase superfamily II)